MRLSRLPEKRECGLLVETMSLLIMCRSEFNNCVISDFLPALPIEVHSLFLSKCMTVNKSQIPNPELLNLIKQVLAESPKNAEWLRLQAIGIWKSDCVEFHEFLKDTIQLVSSDSSDELRRAFSKWIKTIFQIKPPHLDQEVATNEYRRTVISFVVDWIRGATSADWEFVSFIMGQMLGIGIDFWGSEFIADLASNVFEVAIQMLHDFQVAKSTEFFYLFARFAEALTSPREQSCFIDPLNWVILALEFVILVVNDFDSFIPDFRDENDQLEQMHQLEITLRTGIDDISKMEDFPSVQDQLIVWIQRKSVENFTPGVCYVASHVCLSIQPIVSPLVADQMTSVPCHPFLYDFIVLCSEYRQDLADKCLEILIHSNGPLSRVGIAAECLAFYSPEVFLLNDLAGIAWIMNRMNSAPSWKGTTNLLCALLLIACRIPEVDPRHEEVFEVTRAACIQQLRRCSDVGDICNWFEPVIARTLDVPRSTIASAFLGALFEILCERLDDFWKESDAIIQKHVCQIIHTAFMADWVINQMPVFLWIHEMIPKCLVLPHILILGSLSATLAIVGPIEPVWTLLHVFRFPFCSEIANSAILYCFSALHKIVTFQPQFAEHCLSADIIQGLQMNDLCIVSVCAKILSIMALNRVADCGSIFQGSVSALSNRPISECHPKFAVTIYKLWRVLRNSCDDQNGFTEWAIEMIEREVNHGEILELRLMFQSFCQNDLPKEFQSSIVHFFTTIIEHFQTRDCNHFPNDIL
jgi:hypothetical protein